MTNFSVHDSLLGKEASIPERYDASLLFRIPRSENRLKYDWKDSDLPFTGVDVWNCYEFSFLTKHGLPISRIMKMVYPADSTYIVESKSLKLYLNSFNMEHFEATVHDSLLKVKKIIQHDLSELLQTEVSIYFYDQDSEEVRPFANIQDISQYIPITEQESIRFEHYNETPTLLTGTPTSTLHQYAFTTDLLRSNCRVTNQPDWGDLYVKLSTHYAIDFASVIQYLVSFRKENHFHEEVVEMIYKRFWDIFKPGYLVIAAMYTRRGGIDINPIRCSSDQYMDNAFTCPDKRLVKTLRQ